jgi:hypothetical protein
MALHAAHGQTINNSPSWTGACDASTATSGVKASTHGKHKQGVSASTIAVRTPPMSVGALRPQASLSYQIYVWAGRWVAPAGMRG